MAKSFKRKKNIGNCGSTGKVLLCLLGVSWAARAQQVIIQPPSFATTPPAVMADQEDRAGTLPSSAFTSYLPQFSDLLRIGPVTLDPHLTYDILYGNGIQVTPGNSTATLIQQVSPGVTFALGRHFTLDYTPTFSFYATKDLKNSIDHNVNFQWGTSYEDWVLGVSQTYSSTDDPQVSTASQVEAESYDTTLSASYRFNSKLSLDMTVSQSFTSSSSPFYTTNLLSQTPGQLADSRSWSTMEYLNYQFFPRLNAGIGGGIGYSQVTGSPDILDESLQARVSVRVQNKLSLTVHGGLENDQFLGSAGAGSQLTPIFGVAASYAPVKSTLISLTADRSLTPSVFQNQASVNTIIGLNLNQQFFTRFVFSGGLQYNIVNYEASSIQTFPPTVLPDRTDNYYSLNARLSWLLFKRATAALTYQYSKNASTTNSYSFDSSQVGLELGYRF